MKIILKSVPAVVIKNSTFDVSPPEKAWDWDPATHEVYKDLIWKKAQSVVISDQKASYKVWWADWKFADLPFWKAWKIVITFEA